MTSARTTAAFALPPPDPDLSPFTGYTREHWLAVADGLLDAAQHHASPSGARVPLPGRPSGSGPDSDALEGFARTLLLLAIRVASDGGRPDLVRRYAGGLAAGVHPDHPEAWPRITDAVRQTLVEAASVAIGLHLTRDQLWDNLPADAQEDVVSWLQGAFGLTIPDNNWHLFRVVVGEFLASVGVEPDRDEMDADLARVEEFWIGDGWYRDGAHDSFDHYCGWAMHTYPVLIDLVTGPRHSTPTAHERLHRFVLDAHRMFGADGAPMHQGRSLIYRFAAAAAPWVAEVAGCSPLQPGETRRLASGALKHFVDHGFLTADGVPTLGWYDEFPPMVQSYSAPASPFWLAKGFLGLLLPADHPCWTAVEQPLPVELGDAVTDLPAPGWTLSATRGDGIVRLANHGSDNVMSENPTAEPYYARLAYSTVTGPVAGADDRTMPDNHVGLVDADGTVSRRGRIHRGPAGPGWVSSWHAPHWPDGRECHARIESTSVWLGGWELRVHVVTGAAGRPLVQSGWQVAADQAPTTRLQGTEAIAVAGDLTSVLSPVTGVDHLAVAVGTGTSAFAEDGATPWCRVDAATDGSVHVALVGLHGIPPPPRPEARLDGRYAVVTSKEGAVVSVDLRSGEVTHDADTRFAEVAGTT